MATDQIKAESTRFHITRVCLILFILGIVYTFSPLAATICGALWALFSEAQIFALARVMIEIHHGNEAARAKLEAENTSV